MELTEGCADSETEPFPGLAAIKRSIEDIETEPYDLTAIQRSLETVDQTHQGIAPEIGVGAFEYIKTEPYDLTAMQRSLETVDQPHQGISRGNGAGAVKETHKGNIKESSGAHSSATADARTSARKLRRKAYRKMQMSKSSQSDKPSGKWISKKDKAAEWTEKEQDAYKKMLGHWEHREKLKGMKKKQRDNYKRKLRNQLKRKREEKPVDGAQDYLKVER